MIDINSLMNTLESKPDDFSIVVKLAKKEITPCIQKISDIYCESIEGKKRGSTDYASFMLIGKSINDLMCGLHLANQGYISQSYSVLRPILETIDLLSLFESQSQYADKWAEGGKKAWDELSPSKVRKLIGGERFDPIYSIFCEAGSHPTFQSGASMIAMKISEGQPSVSVWIGGLHNEYIEPHLISLYGFIFLLIFKVYSKTLELLNKYQGKDRLNTFPELIVHFENFITSLKEIFDKKGVNISELSDFLEASKSFTIFK